MGHDLLFAYESAVFTGNIIYIIFVFTVLLKQVRRGAQVSNDEILGFAKLFNDELTLDNISRWMHLLLLEFNRALQLENFIFGISFIIIW